MSYLLVSPCRNEAEFMRKTLDSVCNQTVPPDLWVVVDDGSTDETPAILADYAERYPFIQVITRENRGHRSVGPGVIEAFYYGYDKIDVSLFDYVCKFDLDLDLPPRYFEILIDRMEKNPRLGTCSGKAYFVDKNTGKMVSEKCGDEMSVGMTKFYRRTCFEEIGGFVREVMWDGIDCHRCRQLGWLAESWDEEELRFIHLRPMGSSQKGIITGRKRHGFGQYFMGTGLAYMTASSVFRMLHPPVFIGGFSMWLGYVESMLAGKDRFDDKALVKFINDYQWKCLFKGKKAATAELNAKQEPVWLAKHA
ncbi:glycosyltransferase family A protein [Teredinibacter turnerae]|uniref:glycosyltransferase n=1 Tax=Teredinibacter turnerae TaxID=2426 RepID=UPI0030CD08A5